MEELGISAETVAEWFSQRAENPHAVITISGDVVATWPAELAVPLRRCFIADSDIEESVERTGSTPLEVVASVLPDPGSVMSGDFGEFVGLLFHVASEHPKQLVSPKKWRLKSNRLRPAEGADVVSFFLPKWPEPSAEDFVVCSEVKSKATQSSFDPVARAIEGCEQDRKSRLIRTLVWLRERALRMDLGQTRIEHLNRFIDAIDAPESSKKFYAIVVISAEMLADVLTTCPTEIDADFGLVVISVPQLKETYEATFGEACGPQAAVEGGGE